MKKYEPKTIILKLGGSIITKKFSNQPRFRKTIARQLAKELKTFANHFPKVKIIILHGAGSFGHPLVYRYKLLEKPLTGQRLLGFSEVVYSTRRLANILTKIFTDAKLPVLPLQASAMALSNINFLKQVLNTGFIPLLGGDMRLTKQNRSIVVSADELAVTLAKTFPNSKIIFATDVDGVFDKFPALHNAKPLPLISKKEAKSMLKKMSEQKNLYDITGGMAGKLESMLSLRSKEVVIFNGLNPGNLTKALIGEKIGTRLIF